MEQQNLSEMWEKHQQLEEEDSSEVEAEPWKEVEGGVVAAQLKSRSEEGGWVSMASLSLRGATRMSRRERNRGVILEEKRKYLSQIKENER